MTNELEKAKFYLQEAHIFFNSTIEVRRKLDEKIYNMIVLSGVLVNLTFGLTYFLIEQEINLAQHTGIFLVCSIVFYLLTAVFGLIAYRPTDILTRDIKKLIEKYEKGEKEYEVEAPVQSLAWNLSRDAEENRKKAEGKALWFQRMLFAFVTGLFFLMLAISSLLFTLIA